MTEGVDVGMGTAEAPSAGWRASAELSARRLAAITTARMTAFRPGASPPPVNTPMRLIIRASVAGTICSTIPLSGSFRVGG
jgi:hypothetical protein